MHLYELLRVPARIRYAHGVSDAAVVPHPRDLPRVRRGLGPPARVLLFGNGPCYGWGVLSHTQALTGQLAQALFERTQTTWEVNYVGDESLTVATAAQWLISDDERVCEVAVVILGLSDALRLTAEREWRRGIRALLERLEREIAASARIVIGLIPPVRSISGYDTRLGGIAARHALRLNAATTEVVDAFARVSTFEVPPPGFDSAESRSAADGYRRLATIVAEDVVPDSKQPSSQDGVIS